MTTSRRRAHRGNYRLFESFTYYVPEWRGIFILLLLLLVGALVGNIISFAFVMALGAESGTEYGMLVGYPVMFIPAMIYASIKSRNVMDRPGFKLDSNNFSPVGAFLCTTLVIAGTLAANYCTDPISSLLPEMPESLKQMLEGMTGGTLWINFLCVSIFAPLFEEWLCRGMVLRGLLGNNVKPVFAILFSAFFFALIHANPWQAIPAFLLGCLFGYVYYKTGSLKLTMLMHFTNNSFALLLSNIDSLKEIEMWSDLFQGPAYWLIFVGCLMVIVLMILTFRKIESKAPQGNIDVVPAVFDAD